MTTTNKSAPVIFDKDGNPIEITPDSTELSTYEEAEDELRLFRGKYAHLIDVDKFITAKHAEELIKKDRP